MKSILLRLVLLMAFTASAQMEMPESKKTNASQTRFGQTIPDPFSWLEDTRSPEVTQWVSNQNQYTKSHYETVRKSVSTASKIQDYDFYSTNSLPVKVGKYYYSRYIKDRNRPASLYTRKTLKHDAVEVFNTYKLYGNDGSFLSSYYPSKNSSLLACTVSLAGSDRMEIRFVNLDANRILEDKLTQVKFSSVGWNGDRGIFYKKNANKREFEKDSTFQLYYHAIGTPQENDKLVFDASRTEHSFSAYVRENRLYVHEIDDRTGNFTLYAARLENEPFELKPYIENDSSDISIIGRHKNNIYYSSPSYDWGDVSFFQADNPKERKQLIPQMYGHLLLDIDFTDDFVLCKYRKGGAYYLSVYDYQGQFLRKFDMPYNMDFRIRFHDRETDELYVTLFSNVISYKNVRLNLKDGKSREFFNEFVPSKSALFPFDKFTTRYVTFKSRDNKDIPMVIIHDKEVNLDGKNPTLLEAYGGYGIVHTPTYDTGLLTFLEKGGVYAYAEIRGGGEKGRQWHVDGSGPNKINTINDFIDASKFLIDSKYTNPSKLAISGGSHGGMVVASAMLLAPELYKVVIPNVGVMDMLNYDLYTVGNKHHSEYGNPGKEEDFKRLMAYSPYHNIKPDVNYPVTLVVTSENDDRVPPLHSYKFAAALQSREAQKNPVFLLTNTKSGHYGNISSYTGNIQKEADFHDFLWYWLHH